jgi:hypothetical protein
MWSDELVLDLEERRLIQARLDVDGLIPQGEGARARKGRRAPAVMAPQPYPIAMGFLRVPTVPISTSTTSPSRI